MNRRCCCSIRNNVKSKTKYPLTYWQLIDLTWNSIAVRNILGEKWHFMPLRVIARSLTTALHIPRPAQIQGNLDFSSCGSQLGAGCRKCCCRGVCCSSCCCWFLFQQLWTLVGAIANIVKVFLLCQFPNVGVVYHCGGCLSKIKIYEPWIAKRLWDFSLNKIVPRQTQ